MNLLCLFILQCFARLVTGSHVIDEHVIELKDSHIQETLEKASYSFIYFYSDSCGFCHKFNPTFENLCMLYNGFDETDAHKKLQVLKVNARENPRLRQLFKVTQYPTLKLVDYQTKEIFHYDQSRDLNTFMAYFKAKTNVDANIANYKSKVKVFRNGTVLDFINDTAEKDKLVVFTMSYISDWEDYNYPAHFYQQLASSIDSIDFALVDVELLSDTQVLSKYEISNYPSMIYFDKAGRFKVFHTNTQNHIISADLNEVHIRNFIDNINKEDITGKWFNSIDELHLYNEQYLDYEGHKYQKIGLNHRQSSNKNNELSEEEEYNMILENLEL